MPARDQVSCPHGGGWSAPLNEQSATHPHEPDVAPVRTPDGRCLVCMGLTPHLTISLPLTSEQAQAIVVTADAFGVEPWEMAVHVLASVTARTRDRKQR